MQHDCDTNNTSATGMKKFEFDNNTNENTLQKTHPYINYMANERLQGKEQCHSKNYLSEILCSHTKMHLKSEPQKLNSVMAKATSRSYTLDCSCKCSYTFPHCYT